MAYTNSSLVTYKKISPNKTSPRNHVIDTITIHCMVAQWTAKKACDYFNNSNVEASCNYAVGNDGSIGLCVEEKDRSWCSSSSSNDNRAVTIEVASDTTYPYAVTDKALAALIELVADICKRNNIKELKWKGDKSLIGQVDKQNMTVHRWFANKSCPGKYLYDKHPYIVEQVNKKLNVSTVSASTSASTVLKFKVGDIVDFAGGKHYGSANALIGFTVKASKAKVTAVSKNGKHPYHLRAVNDNGAFISGVYGWVNASTVSEIKKTTSTITSSSSDVSIVAGTKLTLKKVALYASSSSATKAATKSGTYYVWNKDVVNNRIRITNSKANVGKSGQVTGWIKYADAKSSVGASTSTSSTASKTSSKSLDDWAKEVINGKHGNGAVRKTSLKKAGCPYTYEQVQARVNKLLS